MNKYLPNYIFIIAVILLFQTQVNAKPLAYIFHNDDIAPLGNLNQILLEHGFEIQNILAFKEDLSLIDPYKPDLVIILGGRNGAYDKVQFIKQEIEYLEQRLTADLPTLGICLGAQLIAKALGAEVFKGHKFEAGWKKLHPTKQAKGSKLADVLKNTEIYLSHGDTFELPKGALLLASSNVYPNQIFRYQRNCLALQFHPEVDEETVISWIPLYKERVSIKTILHIKYESKYKVLEQKLGLRSFWNEWLEEILQNKLN